MMTQPNQRSDAWRTIAGDPVVSFVEAVNAFDADRIVGLFAPDAHVNDQLRDFWGADAISDWVRREIVGMRFSMVVLDAKRHSGDVILSAKVVGEFDSSGLPDPMILSFIFHLHKARIARLIILLTRSADVEPEIRKTSWPGRETPSETCGGALVACKGRPARSGLQNNE